MARYEFGSTAEQIPSDGPHQDLDRNLEFFRKCWKDLVVWIVAEPDRPTYEFQDVKYDSEYDFIQDKHIPIITYDYKSIIFVWKKNKNKTCSVISLHQANQKFKEEVCALLNMFGARGFLRHRDKEADGSKRFDRTESSDFRQSSW